LDKCELRLSEVELRKGEEEREEEEVEPVRRDVVFIG
jgi:hypothetical protein